MYLRYFEQWRVRSNRKRQLQRRLWRAAGDEGVGGGDAVAPDRRRQLRDEQVRQEQAGRLHEARPISRLDGQRHGRINIVFAHPLEPIPILFSL